MGRFHSANQTAHRKLFRGTPFDIETSHSIDGFVVPGILSTGSEMDGFADIVNLKMQSSCELSTYLKIGHAYNVIAFPDFKFMVGGMVFYCSKFEIQYLSNAASKGKDGSLCIKSYADQDGIVHDILETLDLKIISFWFDTSVTYRQISRNPETMTGEIFFGAINDYRFFPNTAQIFTLKSFSGSDKDPAGWEAKDSVSVRIESSTLKNAYPVVFDIDAQLTLLPEAIYDAIVGPVKKVVGNPLLVQGLVPDDAIPLIDSYTGYSERSDYFPCKYTKYLHAFKLNELIVQPEMIYDKADNGECILRVAPLYANRPEIIVVGFHLIKNHHTLVSFDTDQEPFLQFSKRRPSEKSILASCTIC